MVEMVSSRKVAALLMALTVLSGCVQSLQRAHDAPEANTATVAGYSGIRAYRDAKIDEAPENVTDWAPKAGSDGLDFLMISGGGAGGAFTVGVLAAWTDTKTRPHFDVVTGVSTGALIAPYAFLGSAHDKALVHLYTSGVAEDLVAPKGPLGLFGSSLLKSEPLRKMVERFITSAVLDQIASEHRKGRRLLVLTTNLDSQRAVVWNMGAIAASGRPDALKLFQNVMLASASIPGVYPAVTIEAESQGRQFVELHSDGGAASQVSILPQALLTSTSSLGPPRKQKANFYIIVNNALMPEFGLTKNKTFSVMAKAYSIFLKSQAQSELIALHSYARRTGARFHLATIDAQVPYSMMDPFDTKYMRAVYDLGYKGTVSGALWRDTPLFR